MEKRELLVEMQIGAATVENIMEFPQKIKNETSLWPNDSTSGESEKIWNTSSKEYMHPYVHYSAIYNGQAMEGTQAP